jgi:heme oxygenase (biliverdin-IX-beta and delta-forming)
MLQDRGEQEHSRRQPTGTSLRRELRHATEADHRRLEAALDLQSPDLSFERYRRVLAAFHGFYAPLEARFLSFGPATPPLGFALPQRARLLELDLVALGTPAADISCEDLPEIATTAELAGRLYVLEGAALGGQVLARSLARRWQLTPGTGAAFFFGDGAAAAKRRWALVLDWLERVAGSGASAGEAVAAAAATFSALEHWVTAQGATR